MFKTYLRVASKESIRTTYGYRIRLPCKTFERSYVRDLHIPERTALYDFHLKNNGKIVNFAGYALPVQYADQSVIASHLHTRQHASIFDVSHMQQTYIRGKDVVACFESICTADIRNTVNGSGTLTVFTNDSGGILDDLIVCKISDELLYVVSNAAMKQQDKGIMKTAVAAFKRQGKDVHIEFLTSAEQSLIAVQGPHAVAALLKLVSCPEKIKNLHFMTTITSDVAGISNCRITRCGYTGEDGVEISVPSTQAERVIEALINVKDCNVKMAGLGVRDSLRLEAGLCLYGSDIDVSTTPVEAALSWLVAKRRRSEKNFPGAQAIVDQIKMGVARRRVGLSMVDTNVPAARSSTEIFNSGKVVGKITSGCPSPILSKNIAMGYISENLKKPKTIVQLKIRNKYYDAIIESMPFISTKYFTKPK